MSKLDLQPGDIILTRSNSFLSKSIMAFMKAYRKRLGLEETTVFSHAAMVIDVWGELYVAEALGKGITVNKFSETYETDQSNIKVLTPKKVYSKTEKEKISKIASNDAFNPTRYDFLNFFYQIKMIAKTSKADKGDWSGPTGDKAERRLYCTEACATWANKVRPNTFDKPWTVNPVDIDINKYYKVKFDGTVI